MAKFMITLKANYISLKTGLNVEGILYSVQNTTGVKKWLWIFHDKDDGIDGHYHIYVEMEEDISVRQFANMFGICSISVDEVSRNMSTTKIISYLTAKYSVEDIHSNF